MAVNYREYLPIFTGKGFSLKLRGRVYASCVGSCLIYGSETWPMEVEHEARLDGCLLYTSPSPRDGLLSRMPSSA